MPEQTVNWEQEQGCRAVFTVALPGRGEFLSFEEGWLGRGLLIPMSPWKKLATCKKMGDMAGGSGIFRVSSDLFCQSPQIHLVSSDCLSDYKRSLIDI